MIIVASLEIQIAVTAANLPAMKSLFSKITGSSKDPDSEHLAGEGGSGSRGYKLSEYKKNSSGRGQKGKGSLSYQRKGSSSAKRHGATLSESKEKLVRRGVGSIKVTTNVDVTTTRSAPRESSERENYIQFSSR
jgi:hypothetical protein